MEPEKKKQKRDKEDVISALLDAAHERRMAVMALQQQGVAGVSSASGAAAALPSRTQ
jgi:uncharacterized lipoprotein YddW (UPF0748 family)